MISHLTVCLWGLQEDDRWRFKSLQVTWCRHTLRIAGAQGCFSAAQGIPAHTAEANYI